MLKGAKRGHRGVYEILITYSANINTRNCDGKTTLKIAKESHQNDLVKYLVSRGARE